MPSSEEIQSQRGRGDSPLPSPTIRPALSAPAAQLPNHTVKLNAAECLAIRSSGRYRDVFELFTNEPKSLANMQELYKFIYIMATNVRTRELVPGHHAELVDLGKGTASVNWLTREAGWNNGDPGIGVSFVRQHQYLLGAVFGQMSRGAETVEKCEACKSLKTPFIFCRIVKSSVHHGRERYRWEGCCANCRFTSRGHKGKCFKQTAAQKRAREITPDGNGSLTGSGIRDL